MKTRILLLLLIMSSFSFAQQNNDSLINVTIDNFFEGLNTGDTMKIRAAVWRDVIELRSLLVNKYDNTMWEEESFNHFMEVVGTPREEKWEERILSRTIHQDGNIAIAWLPYEFYFEGNYSHEGVNVIQFSKEDGKWVMISILDTRKRLR